MNKKSGITITFIAFALMATLSICNDMKYHKEQNDPAAAIKNASRQINSEELIKKVDDREAAIDKLIDELANEKVQESEYNKQK